MLRFHLPLIKPDVRFSRIRLSDKAFMLSPTESCQFSFQDISGHTHRITFHRDIFSSRDLISCVYCTAIDAADISHVHLLLYKTYLLDQD